MSAGSFRRSFALVVIVLSLLAGGLALVAHQQGPKLDETNVDTSAVTQRVGQQARLFFNEQVAEVSPAQVAVTPAAPFTVTTAGSVVSVVFTDRLAYGAAYTVRVTGVGSVFGGRSADVATRFTTGRAGVFTVVDGRQIVRATMGVTGRQIVYRGTGIRAFAPIGDDLVVVGDAGGTSTIAIVARDGTREELPLPGTGVVGRFALDAPTGTLVFGFTPAGSTRSGETAVERLYRIDLAGNHEPLALTGAGGGALISDAWGMAEGTPVVVSRAPEGALTRADLTVGGTTHRVASLSALSAAERHLLDRAAPLPVAGSDAAVVGSSGRSIKLGGRTLFTAPSGATLKELAASPNGQYLTAVSGGTTLVVDRGSGVVVATFAGTGIIWR